MPDPADQNIPGELPTAPASEIENPSQNVAQDVAQPPSAVQEPPAQPTPAQPRAAVLHTDSGAGSEPDVPPADSPADEPIPRGRPAILTAEKRRTILAMLANGSSRRIAAQYADCSPSTIYRAVERDPEFAAAVVYETCDDDPSAPESSIPPDDDENRP